MKNKQKGFAPILVILFGLVVISGGVYIYDQKNELGIFGSKGKIESSVVVEEKTNEASEGNKNNDDLEIFDEKNTDIPVKNQNEAKVVLENYDSIYKKNLSEVYWNKIIIEGADPNTFQVINETYSKDKNFVYYQIWKTTADPNTFVALAEHYGKDANNVYFAGFKMTSADLSTFIVVDGVVKDKNGIYQDGGLITSNNLPLKESINLKCNSDVNCFMEAIQTCVNATFTRNEVSEIEFGGSKFEGAFNFETINKGALCELKIKMNSYNIQPSKDLLSDDSVIIGTSIEDVYKELNRVGKLQVGKTGYCPIDNEYKNDILSLFTTGSEVLLFVDGTDFCTGDLFNLEKANL